MAKNSYIGPISLNHKEQMVLLSELILTHFTRDEIKKILEEHLTPEEMTLWEKDNA